MKTIKTFVIIITLSLLAIDNLTGQETIKINRIEGQIVFDGNPVEDEWDNTSIFSLVQFRPDFNNDPSEASEVRVGFDDQYLWIGANLYMKDPSKIFMASKKRDERLNDYDAFGIILDTYNDKQNGLAFYTAPTGLRTDYAISNDATGGFSFMNTSWNTYWDVKTIIDETGWHLEMRIPFSSLKFKTEDDIATMGLIITRNISSNNETDTYPALDPKYGWNAIYKPSLAATIEIEGAKPTKPVYISPYVIGGLSWDWQMNDPESDYVKNDPYPKRMANAGLDVKYNINSNLTLDLTANTDFAQVEADDQRVNLSRYSLFFPEKRQFFQERSDLFDFSLGGFSDNLFYSRNIGISRGTPVGILGGARITGRIGNWDMGFLDMQTAEQEDTPGENFGVLRMKRQVINQNSFVGGIITSRLGMEGHQNFSYGIDGTFRLFGDDYLTVKWAQAYDNELSTKMNSLDPSFMLFNWERRSEKGFAYRLNYIYSGEQFRPGVGFVMRGGIQGLSGRILYGWLPGQESKLFRYNISLSANQYNNLHDGKLESMQVSPGFELSTKKGIFSRFSVELQKEGVAWDFNLSDSIKISAGDYTFTDARLMLGTNSAKMISYNISVNAGQFYDGLRAGTNARINFNLSSSFNLSASYGYDAIRFPERDVNNKLDIHNLSLRALYMLNTKLSASFLAQYINTEDQLLTNFRLRYNPREGNDFYLVYNDNRGIYNNIIDSESPRFFNKTVMVKYIHTFTL